MMRALSFPLIAGCAVATSLAGCVGATDGDPSREHAGAIASADTATCTSVTLAASPEATQVVGQPVRLAATAECGGATPELRFWVRPPHGAWTILQDYGAASTATWDTTGSRSGDAELQVEARAQGSQASEEATMFLSYTLTGGDAYCGALDAFATPNGSQDVGKIVTLHASAACDSGQAEYRYWARPPGGAWRLLQDYASDTTYAFDTTGLDSGPMQFEVDARGQGSHAPWDAVTTIDYRLTGGPGRCTQLTLATDPDGAGPSGRAVTISAHVTCDAGAIPQYRFWVQPPGGAWQLLTDYQPASTWTWSTIRQPIGTANLQIDVRAQGSVSPLQAYVMGTYDIQPAL